MGQFDQLSQLTARIESIGASGGLSDVIAALRDEAHEQVIAGFREQRDPYGNAWAPRKVPPDWAIRAFGLIQSNHPLLDDTGAGINSFSAQATPTGIRLRIDGHMKFHLTGTRFMVPRKFFPVDGLGPIWGAAFMRVASQAFQRRLKAA